MTTEQQEAQNEPFGGASAVGRRVMHDEEMFAFDEWLTANRTGPWSDLDLWHAACKWQRERVRGLIAEYEAARNMLRRAEDGSEEARLAVDMAMEKYRQLISIV